MERLIDGERRLRREYSAAFKASVLQQTREPGASVAGVALSHGLHPNMVHRWLREQRLLRQPVLSQTPAFVALPVTAVVADDHVAQPAAAAPTQASGDGQLIRIEVQRASAIVKIEWPVEAAAQCALALRDWLR
jgi:transposase-like protein